MKQYKFLLVLLTLFGAVSSSHAQTGRVGQHEAIIWRGPTTTQSTESEGKKMIRDIMNAVNVQANFEVFPANIPNAAAVTYADKRYILYNARFLDALIKKTGTRWAAVSILAHEVGHHVNGPNREGKSQQELELDADEFSGFVLRKMGASVAQSQIAIRTAGGIRATPTHPAMYDRLAAIENGWQQADGQLTGRSTASAFQRSRKEYTGPNSSVAPAASRNSTRTNTASSNNTSIVAKVVFSADPYSQIYVTSKLHLVKVSNDEASIVGKIARLNSTEYPYVIYDENNMQLFVDNKGNIVTRSGRQVGLLKAFK
jgi:hypothetical protein